MTEPFIRESGSGPTVVCMHASASSSTQWRALSEALSDRFRVVAVDLYGCGRTAAWPQQRPLGLDDEVALLEPVWRSAGPRFHIVGHSYGGAVALKAALTHGKRVASLTVYEPVLFGVLAEREPNGAAAAEIAAVRDDTRRLIAINDLEAAAGRFGSYWLGHDAWAALDPVRRAAMAVAMPSVMPQWQAAFADAISLQDFGQLSLPVQLLNGADSTPAARAVLRWIGSTLPQGLTQELPGCGHLGPVTMPERVNPVIEQFLVRHSHLGNGAGVRPAAPRAGLAHLPAGRDGTASIGGRA